jgi:hypothetical protein
MQVDKPGFVLRSPFLGQGFDWAGLSTEGDHVPSDLPAHAPLHASFLPSSNCSYGDDTASREFIECSAVIKM